MNKPLPNTAPRHKDVWSYTHAGLPVEINHHSKGEMVNDGKGIWCYYVFIPERLCKPGVFAQLWKEDKRIKYFPVSPERITHDYEDVLPDCKWHGGVTFYDKQGHTEGHRCVQVGCDFSHLWDHEQGGEFTLEEIVFEANRTAELVAVEVLKSETVEVAQ